MFKNLLSKNNINLWKNIIKGKNHGYGFNQIALTAKANLNINMRQSFRFSDVNSQNINRGKYNNNSNKINKSDYYSTENRYNKNSNYTDASSNSYNIYLFVFKYIF